MTEKGNEGAERVSLDKPATKSPMSPKPPETTATATPERPKQVTWVVVALLVTGVLALVASLTLYGLHSWIVNQLVTANAKLKGSEHRTMPEVLKTASQQPTVAVIQSAISLLVLAFVASAMWRGRHWSRWAVIGVWVLASFTRIFGGAFGVVYIVQDAPLALKVPVTLSSAAFIVAVALVGFVKPIGAWLNLSRPVRPGAGSTPARRSLFAPPVSPRSDSARSDSARSDSAQSVRPDGNGTPERARAKQRVSAETGLAGAAEARARARGSKSRRTE